LLETIFDPNNYAFWLLILIIIAGAIAIISRPFSTYVKFVYPNAKFETIGNPYIRDSELNKIVDSKNINDFKDAVNNSKNYKISGESINEIQSSFDKNLLETINMMKKDSSKKMNKFFDSYIEKFGLFYVKNAIKNKFEGKEIDEKIIDKIVLPDTKKLIIKIISSEKEELKNIFKDHGFEEELYQLLSKEKIDHLKLDTAFDKHIIVNIKKTKVPYKCDKAKNYFVNFLIDIRNIKNALRGKQLGYESDIIKTLFIGEGQEIAKWKLKEISESDSVPQIISSLQGTTYYEFLKNAIEEYNKDKSAQVLENALDCNLLKIVKDISQQNYSTIGPTIRFIVSKEFEINNLKIITKGIGEGLSTDFIRSLFVKEAGT